MADFFPLYLDTGSIKETITGNVVNYVHFPVSLSFSAAFQTQLPDPYYIYTRSVSIENSSATVSSSLLTFAPQPRREQGIYTVESLSRVNSAAAATAAGRLALKTSNIGDGFTLLKSPNSLTAQQVRHYGTEDTLAENTSATIYAVNNTVYPHTIYGVLINSTTNSFRNEFTTQASAAGTTTRVLSGSMFAIQFAGYSASLSYTQITSSYGSIDISGSNYETANTITASVLPPTASLWITSSLTNAVVTNTSNATYQTVLTLNGMTDGKTYYVQFFTPVRSIVTTTGIRMRANNGTNYTGTIYCVNGNNATLLQNSADGTSITNVQGTAWPAINGLRLNYGEFLVTKAAGSTPTIDILSEINTSAVTATSGSIAIYREIGTIRDNLNIQTPLTLYSGSITAHTIPGGQLLGLKGNSITNYSLYNTPFWQTKIRTRDRQTSVTGQTPTTVTDLQLTLNNSRYYLIIGYIGVGSTGTATGPRPSITIANSDFNAWTVETLDSSTAVNYGHNTVSSATNGASTSGTNYYMCKVRAIVRTAAAGVPTFAPTIQSDANNTTSTMGPGILYYYEFN